MAEHGLQKISVSEKKDDKAATPNYVKRSLAKTTDPTVPGQKHRSVKDEHGASIGKAIDISNGDSADEEFTFVDEAISDDPSGDLAGDTSSDSPEQNTPPNLINKERKEQPKKQERKQSYVATELSFFSAEKSAFFDGSENRYFENWKIEIVYYLEKIKEQYKVPEVLADLSPSSITKLSSEYCLCGDELKDKLVLENKVYNYKLNELMQNIKQACSPDMLLKILETEYQKAKFYNKCINNPQQGQATATAIYGRYGAFVLEEMPGIYAQYRAYLDRISVNDGVNARVSPK